MNLRFWEQDDRVWTEFTPAEQHQGYPGLMHGGLLYTILDEVTGRAAYLRKTWVYSGKVEVRYHKPASIGETLRFSGRIISDRSRAMELEGEARFAKDGTLVATARGLFMKLTDAQLEEAERAISFPPGEEPRARKGG